MTLSVSTSGPFIDVVITNALEPSDLAALLDAIDRARRSGPFVVLTDTLAMSTVSPQVASDFADALKRMPSLKDVWIGDAVVVSSAIARFVLSRLIIVAPLPTEVKVFDARAPARAWLASVLDRNNVRVPSSLKLAETAAKTA
ncbi:STAS/SEC14 domain-containing protein [Sandaracinus amylolyticus]|uniref:STAS/SEC14 domain-containing protein n=1 Tax=Sandaracinus amylolyticus TaxID=927083 RepID=A0A0F6VZZ6_9BACT|nr:STAS/SEC14 domain-containing protein [Sandaracinus amylolyticus]AKF03746.1 hypothetical protein DB32_000895 [Sandaracinus amylolyticus]